MLWKQLLYYVHRGVFFSLLLIKITCLVFSFFPPTRLFALLSIVIGTYAKSVLRHVAFTFFSSFFLRIEYDAYRTDLEELNLGPRDANTLPKIEQSQQLFQVHKEKYDKMRNDVSIKLKFLEENKVSNSFWFCA